MEEFDKRLVRLETNDVLQDRRLDYVEKGMENENKRFEDVLEIVRKLADSQLKTETQLSIIARLIMVLVIPILLFIVNYMIGAYLGH